jgi:hypothetical protein
MPEQSYANHARYVFGFHVVLTVVILTAAILGGTHFYRTMVWGQLRMQGAAIVLLVVACGLLMWYTRTFALKAQDRAIRAEESLRHYLLTGKPIDARLRLGQVIALRFASDEELPALAQRAAEEGLRGRDIKQAIRHWRPDHHRA